MKSKVFSVLLALTLLLFAVSASVAAPILCRPFYYAHIEALDLPQQTGLTHGQIRQAFDEVMDYLVMGAPFGTGDLAWSEEGRSHFADCRVLFMLDLRIFALTALFLLAVLIHCKSKALPLPPLADRGPSFWAGIAIIAVFSGFALLAAADFERAFTLFHRLLFPGKDNWVFDIDKDRIIQILPQDFFRNCAILIGVLLALFAVVYLKRGAKRES